MNTYLHEQTALLSGSDQIDCLCDEFERELQEGQTPRIESFIGRVDPELVPALLVELIKVEVEASRSQGESPDVDEYRRRFPAFSSLFDHVDLGLSVRTGSIVPALPGRFVLRDRIGVGGFGAIWRAEDTQLGRTVALKIPHAVHMYADGGKSFLREAKAAAQLRHPNIVAVFDFGTFDQLSYIVYEYIDGLDLRAWIKSALPSADDAARMCAKVAHALHHIHTRGMVHRDIKPANILIDKLGEPRITDLGLAKLGGAELTLSGKRLAGTPAYMAPEQARAEKVIGPAADIYALGATLYELLTGRPPFEGSVELVLHKLSCDDPIAPRKVNPAAPRDVQTICMRAMSKDASQRYASAEEMALDLERFLRREPIKARPVAPIERAWRWVRRNRMLAGTYTALLCLAVALAATVVAGNVKPTPSTPGLRPVSIVTNPPGAAATLVPLDRATGELRTKELVNLPAGAPLDTQLRPGDYLVVAALPDGRFHEVYRHVPETFENLPGAYRHNRWEVQSDGTIRLPMVHIPPSNVTEGMALISAADRFRMGTDELPMVPPYDTKVRSYYMDTHEFTVGEYRRVFNGHAPLRKGLRERPDNFAVCIEYDAALATAERAGKRLATEIEFEYAAVQLRKALPAPRETVREFGPAGTPRWDRTRSNPPIVGLATNVAEWTSSWFVQYPKYRFIGITPENRPGDFRMVRGGDRTVIDGDPTFEPIHRNSRGRVPMPTSVWKSGLGFRCVRSEKPRLTTADF